jgi:hypothetical protein
MARPAIERGQGTNDRSTPFSFAPVCVGDERQVGHARPPNLQRTADDFDEMRVSAADYDDNCRGLWQRKPLYFNDGHCSRL